MNSIYFIARGTIEILKDDVCMAILGELVNSKTHCGFHVGLCSCQDKTYDEEYTASVDEGMSWDTN